MTTPMSTEAITSCLDYVYILFSRTLVDPAWNLRQIAMSPFGLGPEAWHRRFTGVLIEWPE